MTNYKAFVVYAHTRDGSRPGGDYLFGTYNQQEAVDRAKEDYLYGRPGWRLQVRCIPERYGDPVAKYWVK